MVLIALPTLGTQIGPSRSAWLAIISVLASSGLLLIGGRLCDLFGQRRLFLLSIAAFTVASFTCGLTNSPAVLIGARAAQGMAGAVIGVAGLALLANLYPDPNQRARAFGFLSFATAAGWLLAEPFAGALIGVFNWHWMFLAEIPIGLVAYALGLAFLPRGDLRPTDAQFDSYGTVLIIATLLLCNSVVISGNQIGWLSLQSLLLCAGSLGALILFVRTESRARAPLVPLQLFRRRELLLGSSLGVLWVSAFSALALFCPSYIQLILGHTPFQVALAFTPYNLLFMVLSLRIAPALVIRFGIQRMLVISTLFIAAGLLLLAQTRTNGSIALDVLPGTLLVALGGSTGSSPLLLLALRGARPTETGLVTGMYSTLAALGGSFGSAMIVGLAALRTKSLLALGMSSPIALNSGYHIADLTGAVLATTAALLAQFLLRDERYALSSANIPPGVTIPGNSDPHV